MNRSWITALTLATVAGTGGAFVGVITVSSEQRVEASPESTAPTVAALVDVTAPRLEPAGAVAYRLGSVGTVTVHVAKGQLTIVSSVADAGWTALATSGGGTHVEAGFTDTAQLVTFAADLAGNDVMVAVNNVAIATDSVAAPPIPAHSAPATTAETSPPTTQTQLPMPAAPSAPQTAPQSTTGDDHRGDDGVHDDNGTEPNDD